MKKQVTVKVEIDINEEDNRLCGDNCPFIVEANCDQAYYCGLWSGKIRNERTKPHERTLDTSPPFYRVKECIDKTNKSTNIDEMDIVFSNGYWYIIGNNK